MSSGGLARPLGGDPLGVSSGRHIPQPRRSFGRMSPVMRDRSKNRKPLQRGRISTEAIQAVQALKRSKTDEASLRRVFQSKLSRLLKRDLMAVLRELQRQDESLLALQVFEGVRSEYWYKPQASLYVDMVRALASNGHLEEVRVVVSWLKKEVDWEAEGNIEEGFNALLGVLVEFKEFQSAMECFHLMKVVGCEMQESTFRILVNGFEAGGRKGLSDIIRQEAEKYFGEILDFSEEKEEASLSC